MAKEHTNQPDVQGIKLFGKTISVPEKQEINDHPPPEKQEDNSNQNTEEIRPEKIIPCPRCKSMETKFCYFNNYNVNQPRHFCKGCQRYWTAGGALRNVPVGAGRRKMKSPCGGGIEGFSEGTCLFDQVCSGVQEWHTKADKVMSENFGHNFPAKRRRI